MSLQKEIIRRSTFGIISHPDAGKTALTEKLLLYGGAIQETGAVKSNKIKKHSLQPLSNAQLQLKKLKQNERLYYPCILRLLQNVIA